ncbi:MAG: hypothetical protein ACETWG_07110, partial [Candidatus Neomarinimicrobiota bacterium]
MRKIIRCLFLFTALFLFISGCEETLVDEEVDAEAAAAKASEAIAVLENEFYTLINSVENDEIDQPGDVDFTTSNGLFKEAIALDANNLDANFGAGLTELLIFGQEPDVQQVFEAWEAFLDTGSAFVAEDFGSLALSWGWLLPGPGGRSPIQKLNEKGMAYSYLNLFKLAVSDPPTIGDIQDIIESVFLPRLDYALERFDVVDDDPSYAFTITPKMQGDLEEDAVEFDLTELYVLETAVNLLRSFCSVAVAYTVGPSAYDSAAVIEFLAQGSGFLSLRPNGAGQIAKAKETLLEASYKLDDAVAFLKAETDDQSDDIITITPGELEEADLDSVTRYNEEFRDYFLNGITLTEDWDDDGTETDLTFDFNELFDNPVQDFKSLLPDYTVTVGRDTSYDYDWESFDSQLSGMIDVTTAGYYTYHRQYWYSSWDGGEDSYENITKDIPEFTRVVDSLLSAFRGDALLSYWEIYIYWYEYVDVGQWPVQATIYVYIERRVPEWSYYTGI